MVWIPSIRTFLASFEGYLELEKDFVPKLQRENDIFLMDMIVDQDWKPSELQRLMRVDFIWGEQHSLAVLQPPTEMNYAMVFFKGMHQSRNQEG